MSDNASSGSAKCARFLSPREYLGRFQGLIQHGPEKPSANALARADARARFEMALSAAAIREANSQLQDPIRIRFAMDVDDGGATRPCAQCSLHVDTAFAKARDRCTLCDHDFCLACLRKHVCRRPGVPSIEDAKAAPDDSTAAQSSDDSSSSDADMSDISVE